MTIPYELSAKAADESWGEGMRTAASRDFEKEMQAAVDAFVAWREREGDIYYPGLGAPVIRGPFLPINFEDPLPRHSDELDADGDPLEIPRKRETSIEQTKGLVEWRIAAPFLVREHIASEIVERDKDPARYAAIKNARKENGLWKPKMPAPKQHFPMPATL